jgi:hypothetical protein
MKTIFAKLNNFPIIKDKKCGRLTVLSTTFRLPLILWIVRARREFKMSTCDSRRA